MSDQPHDPANPDPTETPEPEISEPPEPPDPAEQSQTGPELARAVLDAALARRATAGGGRGGAARTPDRLRPAGGSGWSSAVPDGRDPQRLRSVLGEVVRARGWQRPAAEATLFGRWEQVVGAEVAAHCRPVKLERGELTLEASSTAWATQLRLLAASLLRKIAAEVGHDIVTRLRVHGPAAPSWNRGPRRVRGRGPRDTYG